MTIKQLLEKLPIQALTRELSLEVPFDSVYSSDLLSQVLAKATIKDVWITVQTHATILGIASIKQVPCILFSEGLVPLQEVVDKAQEEGIILLSCKQTTYQIGGEIFKLLTKENGE